ncbi:MAG TPA: histidine kinase [Bellilinea sp.]|nr:histidine kinase [Bellilinea sp.]
MFDRETNKRLTNNNDIAFTVVVLAAYFTAFANLKDISPLNVILLMVLAVIFIASGTYGYKVVQELNDTSFKYWYLGTQILLGAMIVYLINGAGFSALILIPIAAHAVTLLDIERTIIPVLFIIVSYAFVVWSYSQSLTIMIQSTSILIAGLIFIIAFTQLAVNEAKSRKRVERLVDELTVANELIKRNAEEMKELAIMEERNRIAHEIHDGLGHYLTTINMELQTSQAIRNKDQSRADYMVGSAQRLTKKALTDVRESVFTFKNPILSSAKSSVIVNEVVDSQKNSSFEIISEINESSKPSSSRVNWAMYRILQETLNNIKSHSRAKCVWIHLSEINGMIKLSVKNDGVTATEIIEGFGLMGIRERVTALKGSMEYFLNGDVFNIEVIIPNE